MALAIENSCEVDNLMEEVIEISGENWDSVESAFFKAGLYPESTKTYISWNDKQKMDSVLTKFVMSDHPNLKWLDDSLVTIFKKYNINSIYITTAI